MGRPLPESLSCPFPQLLLRLRFSGPARLTVSGSRVSRSGAQGGWGGSGPGRKGNVKVGQGWVKGQRREGKKVCLYGGGGQGWVGLKEEAEDPFSPRLLGY